MVIPSHHDRREVSAVSLVERVTGRPLSQKPQVPVSGALPRGFVSARDGVRRSLSVWTEEHGGVAAFGTRVWPDLAVRHFAIA